MIVQNTLRVSPREGGSPLFLAPYGEEEFKASAPFSREGLIQLQPIGFLDEYDRTPSDYMAGRQSIQHCQEWGMYDGEVSPAAFVGSITLEEDALYLPPEYTELTGYSKAVQTVGTTILRPEKRGKGIGSVAKMAVISYAMEADGTVGFKAATSDLNKPAQRSLHKVGFSYSGSCKSYEYPNGEDTQWWMLVEEGSIDIATESDSARQDYREGWQRYQALARQWEVTECK